MPGRQNYSSGNYYVGPDRNCRLLWWNKNYTFSDTHIPCLKTHLYGIQTASISPPFMMLPFGWQWCRVSLKTWQVCHWPVRSGIQLCQWQNPNSPWSWPYGIFYHSDNVSTLYLLPQQWSGILEGADRGVWGCTIMDHVASMCNNSLDGAAGVAIGEGMVW